MYKFCPNCGFKVANLTEEGFKCQNCHKSFYLNSKPTAAILATYQGEMLIAIRAIDPAKGQMDTVGGFLGYGEEPLAGAVREFKEETGLEIHKDDLELIGMWIDAYQFEAETYKLLNIFYYIELPKKYEGIGGDDVAELKWVPIEREYRWAFNSSGQAHQKLRQLVR